MSLSCVMAFVPNITTASFGSLAEKPRTFEEVIGERASRISVAQVGSHVLVASSGDLWKAPVLSTDPEGAVLVILDEDICELSTFGRRSRTRQVADGELTCDEGEPLSVETVFTEIDDPETSHLELVCRLAGITRDDLRNLDWYTLTPWWKKAFVRLFRR